MSDIFSIDRSQMQMALLRSRYQPTGSALEKLPENIRTILKKQPEYTEEQLINFAVSEICSIQANQEFLDLQPAENKEFFQHLKKIEK